MVWTVHHSLQDDRSRALLLEEFEQLSCQLAIYLRASGVRPGNVIPLCFEKSKWVIISMLGVVQAGGSCVFLDPVDHPQARMAAIVHDVDAPFAVCAPHLASKFQDTVPFTIRVDQTLFEKIPIGKAEEPYDVKPHDTAFVMFTSGSTGRPKDIIHDRQALCSSYTAFGPSLCMASDSRVFQYAGYTFDVCIIDMVAPLILVVFAYHRNLAE